MSNIANQAPEAEVKVEEQDTKSEEVPSSPRVEAGAGRIILGEVKEPSTPVRAEPDPKNNFESPKALMSASPTPGQSRLVGRLNDYIPRHKSRIKYINFNVPRGSVKETMDYYQLVMGMEEVWSECKSNLKVFRYACEKEMAPHTTHLKFMMNDAQEVDLPRPGFWKIGIVTQDCDTAAKRIRNAGKTMKHCGVGKPMQFENIGYLCHCRDPFGNTIELLQDTFKHNFRRNEVAPTRKSNLIAASKPLLKFSLRTRNPEESLLFYQERLGMKLLAKMPVENYGFCLYFLAYTHEDPPVPDDLEDVRNREWLWRRDYTTLELQHSYETPKTFRWGHPNRVQSGFQGITIETGDRAPRQDIKDPDGYRVTII